MASSEKRKVTAEDIENLIEIFKQSSWDEMHLEADGLEIFLSNDPTATTPRTPAAAVPSAAMTNSAVANVVVPAAASVAASSTTLSHAAGGAGAPIPDGQVAIRAPNLGTFYRAPKPGAPTYIEVGQQIEVTTEVCLIEVMKLFTPVQSGLRGIVREIRARDGQMVEFDAVLIIIEPN